MIEAGANEVPEAKMIEAIFAAHELNQEVIKFIDTIVAECGKEKHADTSCAVPEELFAAMKEIVTPEEMEAAVFTDEKQVREKTCVQSEKNWKKHLQKMKNGLKFWEKHCISTRRKQSVR